MTVWPAVVSPEWLSGHLNDPDLVLLDARFTLPGVTPAGPELYAAGHIPGARYFDVVAIADPESPLPSTLPSPAFFAQAMARLGVGNRSRVVVYDADGVFSAARVWWMLRCFGHEAVHVLDGGLAAWTAQGGAVTQEVGADPVPAVFVPDPRPALRTTQDEVAAALGQGGCQILDARAADRFSGSVPEPRPGYRAGHIPGSLNLPYKALTDPATGRLRTGEDLRAVFRDAGADPDAETVVTCGSGISACALAFGLHLLGNDRVRVYDGSWAEWGRPDGGPVEQG